MLNYEETRLQKSCFAWAVFKHPNTRGLLCYNLNNSANARAGRMNRELGLTPGRSDLVLYWKGKAYMFELKAPLGRQTPSQKEWQNLIEEQGFNYFIIRTLDDFMRIFEQIITLC